MIVRAIEPRPAAALARLVGRGAAPSWWMSPDAGDLTATHAWLACDPVEIVRGSSLAALTGAWQAARARWRGGPGTPVAVGHFSYDLGRTLIGTRSTPPPASGWPAIEVRFYDAICVCDSARGTVEIRAIDESAARALEARLHADDAEPPTFTLSPLLPSEPPDRHLRAVARVRDYLAAGDAYQVNLARRLEARCRSTGPLGLALFTQLTVQAPAPHAIWMADGDRALVGNSPERFLRLTSDGWLSTEPIKGTRARGETPAEDERLAHALLTDPKDRAEHVMIVDLERNDLGRVCATGSVEVVDPLRLLPLPRVQHLVSTVRGRLRAEVTLEEILRATFPGGSITGAPKIRAMEIIDELEPAQRGPYTGATGWLGAAGDFDLAVAIRTALLDGEALRLWVGGGIVFDSSPAAELAETEVKARAFAELATPPLVISPPKK